MAPEDREFEGRDYHYNVEEHYTKHPEAPTEFPISLFGSKDLLLDDFPTDIPVVDRRGFDSLRHERVERLGQKLWGLLLWIMFWTTILFGLINITANIGYKRGYARGYNEGYWEAKHPETPKAKGVRR